MNETELILAGIDMDDLMKRLMGNQALVRILVKKFLEDKNHETLLAALSADNLTAAEHACHTLKGMCGNMSLRHLFDLYMTQLTHFRQGRPDDARAMMEEIDAAYRQATSHMQRWLNG